MGAEGTKPGSGECGSKLEISVGERSSEEWDCDSPSCRLGLLSWFFNGFDIDLCDASRLSSTFKRYRF